MPKKGKKKANITDDESDAEIKLTPEVAAHCVLLKVNLKYIDHIDKDEEVYRNICNMTALNKQCRRKITVSGGKGSSNGNPKQKG